MFKEYLGLLSRIMGKRQTILANVAYRSSDRKMTFLTLIS